MTFGIDTKRIADGALLGAGLLIGAILVSGTIKTVNRFSGGMIPHVPHSMERVIP